MKSLAVLLAIFANDEELEEIKKCYEQNEDYIMECTHEGNQQALTLRIKKYDMDENTMKCTLFDMVTACYINRSGDKCSEKAARIAEEEVSDMPDEIAEACKAKRRAIDDTDIYDAIHRIGDKKRK